MIETHLNIFDAVVLGIMALSCLFAFFRGLVREILSLLAWVGAAIVTLHYFSEVVTKLQAHFKSPTIAIGLATLGLYISSLIGFAIVNTIIIKTFKRGEPGVLDNLLGLIFGAARGILIISLGYFLLTIALPEKEEEYPDWLKQAVTRPYAQKGAQALAKIAPEYLQEIAALQKKATKELMDTQKKEGEKNTGDNSAEDSKDDTGYSTSATSRLGRLLESSSQDKGKSQ